MWVFEVKRIVVNYIRVDSILFDPAVSKIFYFKHLVGASGVINFNNFIGDPDVDSFSVVSDAFSVLI